MARPESKKVVYFPHPVKAGKKMAYIKHKYGNEGYAVWYQLLEQLGDAEDHYLNMGKNCQKMLILGEIGCDETTLFNVIDDLIIFEVFSEKLWNEKRVVYSQKFVDSIKDVYARRKTACPDESSLCKRFDIKTSHKPILKEVSVNNNSLNVNINTQSKVNKSKVLTKQEYLKTLDDFLETIKQEWIDELVIEYPLLDVVKTLKKILDYWRTDEGYQRKLKTKSKTIDWKATIKNGFNMDFNGVLK